jgi:hypothetical protein
LAYPLPVPSSSDLAGVTTGFVTLRIPGSSKRVLRENFLDLRELANAELQSVYSISLNVLAAKVLVR